MKFAIISDTHDHQKNVAKVLTWLKENNITTLLHCGDVCFPEMLANIKNNFSGDLCIVRGNGDFELRELPEELSLEIAGLKIFMNHYPEVARQKAESGKFDFVFYGHTHKPWEEKVGQCRLVNPGELAGQRFKPTFAIYDTETKKLELKILELL